MLFPAMLEELPFVVIQSSFKTAALSGLILASRLGTRPLFALLARSPDTGNH